MNQPTSNRGRGAGGFSLIEVTIAMAIAAIALSTLMALIPQGMNTMRDAGDEAIMARIHQQILNELQMADFDALDSAYTDSGQPMELYYDSQGEELGDSKNSSGAGIKGSFEHVYTARITIPRLGGGSLPESVGGGSFDGFTFDRGKTRSALLRPVVIEVAAVAGLAQTFDWSEKYRHLIETYQTSVVKMGQAYQ